jgi:hypothetical protein
VTTAAILVWLVCWFLLEYRWSHRNVSAVRFVRLRVAVGLLVLSVLLTFPPIGEHF